MNLDNLSLGENVPHDINVVIEIPSHGSPVKYEADKDSGMLTVGRFMGTAMIYPCNNGFMPHTQADDGAPVDDDVKSAFDLHNGILEQSSHFFDQYRALDSAKWVKLERRVGVEEAEQEILDSIQRYKVSDWISI